MAKAGNSKVSKVNWKKALPFGTHIRETIEDLRIIRSSLRRGHKRVGSLDKANRRP